MQSPHLSEEGPNLRVALCQVFTEEWAVEENFRRALEAIETAGRLGAQIAVTPECVIHGYAATESERFHERLYEAAEPVDGERLRQVRRLAEELHLSIVFGLAERGGEGRVHNSAALISERGELVYIYRKVHCRPFESIYHSGGFTPGSAFYSAPLLVGSDIVNAGTLICFDREIPESVRCLRALGAEIVFCPLATDTTDFDSTRHCADNELLTLARAAENEVFIVVVNHAGRFNGGSFACGPSGELLCQMGSEPGVQVVELPLGAVRKLQRNPLGWAGWGYRRQEIYDQYLK